MLKRFFALFLAALLLFSVSASAGDSDFLKWRKRFVNLSSDELQDAARALVSVLTFDDIVTLRSNIDRVLFEYVCISLFPVIFSSYTGPSLSFN